LPEEVNGEGLTVGRGDEGKRVVVPDDVVDAMIEEQDAGGDGTEAVDEPLIPELAQTPPTPAAPDSRPEPAAPRQTAQPEAASQPASANQTLPLDAQALLAVPAQRYALQLAALQSRQDAVDLIANYQLEGRVQVYQTRRNGGTWYMVLLGDYESVTAARRAELTLADNVRALQPFVKSFSQIHREINRANGQ
jgi:DamX protein